jgi:uncharacterized protein YyaL (SSP411 family)
MHMTTSSKAANRLAFEKSPYLLQHKDNPVDWYPWGEEAFAKAKLENKPVFLSIGYSTCHWCHVMAHESFEDDDVAAVLNRDYISIKVDREERPDIDTVYMEACQVLTGSGGWPLTVIMTPEQKPFWAGTYLPKTAAYGRLGLMELLDAVKQQWDTEREKVLSTGEQITSFLIRGKTAVKSDAVLDKELLHRAAAAFEKSYDQQWGGFGAAPKFPTPHNLLFLLRYALLEDRPLPQQMAEHTLRQMFRGGIFDHLGSGFSRYSTDSKWLVPHFEKMLYDNALLAIAYLEAYHITRQPFYSMVAERIFAYVLHELTDEQGGFYCGQDADSEGVEGKFYVFTRQEIDQVLGEQQGKIFSDWFDITEGGNFEGQSIPNLLDNPQYEAIVPNIQDLSQRLYDYRLQRTDLHKDDKILTSWNALMIAALAKAGCLLDKPAYVQAAQSAQRFLQDALTDEQGRLYLRWREGETAHAGQLDDYAFYAFALLELYKSTYELDYLQQALKIARQMLEQFGDCDTGGLFFYGKDSEQLINRPKETYDGAIPSGNSVAGLVLESLAKLTGETRWQQASYQQLTFLAGAVQNYPPAHSMALLALAKNLYPSQELICVTAEESLPAELKGYLAENALPNLSVLLKTAANKQQLAEIAPFTESYPLPAKGSIYYLCQNGACALPVDNLRGLIEQLQASR